MLIFISLVIEPNVVNKGANKESKFTFMILFCFIDFALDSFKIDVNISNLEVFENSQKIPERTLIYCLLYCHSNIDVREALCCKVILAMIYIYMYICIYINTYMYIYLQVCVCLCMYLHNKH